MRMPGERMERLKQSVKSDQTEEQSAPGKPEMDKIIKRLQDSMGDQKKGVPTMKQKLEGDQSKKPLDFNKVSFEAENGIPDQSNDSFLSFVGRFYGSFTPTVAYLANVLAKVPGSANLRNDLDASDINMNPEAFVVAATVAAMIVAGFSAVLVPIFALVLKQPVLSAFTPIVALVMFFVTGVFALTFPRTNAEQKAIKINRELPFALRHLSTQIKAGVSFHRALSSVAAADYGILSVELTKVLRDLEKGNSTEDALLSLARRNRSAGLKKAVIQINRSLKTGGNLSEIIKDIANDVSFEYQMRVRDFVEKLNIINVVFTMIAVVGPVVITIISAVSQLPSLGSSLPFSSVIVMFMADVMAMMVIVWFIMKMESDL